MVHKDLLYPPVPCSFCRLFVKTVIYYVDLAQCLLSSLPYYYYYYSILTRNFFQLWHFDQIHSTQSDINPALFPLNRKSWGHRKFLFHCTKVEVGFDQGRTQRADPEAYFEMFLCLPPAQQKIRSTGRRGQEDGHYMAIHSSCCRINLHILSIWEERFFFPTTAFLPTLNLVNCTQF